MSDDPFEGEPEIPEDVLNLVFTLEQDDIRAQKCSIGKPPATRNRYDWLSLDAFSSVMLPPDITSFISHANGVELDWCKTWFEIFKKQTPGELLIMYYQMAMIIKKQNKKQQMKNLSESFKSESVRKPIRF